MNATRRELSLAHLSVLDATLPQMVTVAAGFRNIGMCISATPSVGVPPYDMLGDTPMLRETLARLADTGVSVLDVVRKLSLAVQEAYKKPQVLNYRNALDLVNSSAPSS